MAKEVIIGRVGIKVTADIEDDARAKLLRQAEKLERDVERGVDPIHFEAELKDKGELAREAKEARTAAQKVADEPIETTLKVNTKDTVKDVKKATEAASDATEPIEIPIELDKKSKAGAAGDLRRTIAQIQRNAKLTLGMAVNKNERTKVQREIDDIIRNNRVELDVLIDEDVKEKMTRSMEDMVQSLGDQHLALKYAEDPITKAKLKRAVQRLDIDLEKLMGSIDAELEIQVNERSIEEATERIRKQTSEQLDKIFVNVHPDVDVRDLERARGQIADVLSKIADQQEILLQVDLDEASKSRARAEISKLEDQLDDDVKKEVVVGLRQSSYAAALGQLAFLTRNERKEITVSVKEGAVSVLKDVARQAAAISSNLTGSRFLWDLHKKKFEAFKNFDQVAIRSSMIATSLASASAWATQLAGDILSVANDLGSIIGLAPVMVSGLGMIAAQGFIFKQAFSDIADRFPEMNDGFTQLGVTIRDKFWAEAETAFSGMYDKLFPEFEAGMSRLATSTGGMFAALSDGFTEFGKGRIGIIFENWAASTDILKGSMGALSYILLETLKKGSEYLPRISQGFTDAANGMADWLAKASQSGELDQWINRAIENTKALGVTVWKTGEFLAILGDYAQQAGATTLKSMAETMAGAVEVIKTAGFREGFVAILTEANAFMDQLAGVIQSHAAGIGQLLVDTATGSLPALGSGLSEALGGLLKGLTDPEFAKGVNEMFTEIGRAIGSIAPALELVGPKLGIVFGFIGKMFGALIPVAGHFVEELAVILDKVHQPIDNLLSTLGPALDSIMTGLSPMFAGFGQAIATIATHLTPVVAQLGQLGPVISPVAAAIGELVAALAGVIGPMLPMIAGYITNLVTIVAPFIAQLITAVSNLLTTLQPVIQLVVSALPMIGTIVGVVFAVIISAITGLINGITSVVQGIMNILGGVITFLTGVFTGDWQAAWDGIKQIALGIWQVIKGAFLIWMNIGIVGVLKGGVLKLLGIWRGGWTAVWNFVKGIWTSIVSWVQGKAIAMGVAITTRMAAIRAAWSAGWSAIKAFVVNAAVQIVARVASMANSIKTFISNGINAAKTIFSAGWTAIKEAATKGISGVVSLVAGIPAKIRAALGNLGQVLYSAGQQILQGLINGVQSMIGGLRDTFSGITNMIPNWKGPMPVDRRLLIPSGRAIMGGLIKGINDEVPELRNELQDITKMIESTDFTATLSIDSSELDRLDKARNIAASQLVTPDGAVGSAGMVNNFEMHMGNQYTPEDVSGEILYNLRRTQRSGVYRKE